MTKVPHPYSAAAAGRAEGAWHAAAAPDLRPGGADFFYRGERGTSYPVQDDADWLTRYQTLWARHRDGQICTRELVSAVLSVESHWEQDLSQIPGLVDQVAADLDAILTAGCATPSGRSADSGVSSPGCGRVYWHSNYLQHTFYCPDRAGQQPRCKKALVPNRPAQAGIMVAA